MSEDGDGDGDCIENKISMYYKNKRKQYGEKIVSEKISMYYKNKRQQDTINTYYSNRYHQQKKNEVDKVRMYYGNKCKQETKKELIKKHIENVKDGGFMKIYECIISRINRVLVANGITNNIGYHKLLGCAIDKLEEHITGQFVDGMTIENHGDWEVDHIIPIASFDFTIQSNLYKCFHYTNLQPLWWLDNRRKSDKIL